MNPESEFPELELMVSNLRSALEKKVSTLQINDSYSLSVLDNRSKEIDSFEFQTKKVQASTFEKQRIIENFQSEATRIIQSIDAMV